MIDWEVVLIFAVPASLIAWLVTGYLVTNNKLQPPFLKPAQIFYYSICACYGLAILGGIGYAAVHYYTNESGWVPRNREIEVYVHASNWVVGELKICRSLPTEDKAELTVLFCSDDAESHTLKVKFWGPITADRNKMWKCEREFASLTCKLQ